MLATERDDESEQLSADEETDVEIDTSTQFIALRGKIRFMTINMDGARPDTPNKITELGALLHQRAVDVCLISETHLRDDEAPRLKIADFEYANHCSREPEVVKICGGVAIYVRKGLHHKKVDFLPRPADPMTTCSILLYVHDEQIKTLRVTAVYFPPMRSLRMEMVSMLTDPSVAMEEEGEMVGHVLGGTSTTIAGAMSLPSGYLSMGCGCFRIQLLPHSAPATL